MNTVTMHPTHLQNPAYQTQSNDDIIGRATRKIAHVATDIFKKLESFVVPALTKLTTRGIAEGLFYGSVSGLVTGLVFIALGLPTDNPGLNILTYCISYQYFRPHQESRDATAAASTQTTPLLSPESLTTTILEEKPV